MPTYTTAPFDAYDDHFGNSENYGQQYGQQEVYQQPQYSPAVELPQLNLQIGHVSGIGGFDLGFGNFDLGFNFNGLTIPSPIEAVNNAVIPPLATNPIIAGLPNVPIQTTAPTPTPVYNWNPAPLAVMPTATNVFPTLVSTPAVVGPVNVYSSKAMKIINKAGFPIDGVQVFIDSKLVTTSDVNGTMIIENVASNAVLTFKAKNHKNLQITTDALPPTVVLDSEVIAVAKYPWWWWLIGGVVVFGGYKCFFDKKTNKVIRAEI